MQIFFQLQKIDEKTGIVSGRAVEEVLDHAGEIFDYAKSKPHFEAWSQNISKATDGKSVGNVRAMHGKVAAGKLTDIVFNDAEKAIDVTAKIVDPVEKAKLLEGVYTGFSIGGSYVTKWEDPVHKGVMRYEAEPSEISIVDLPCVPTATFTAIKADGSQELRKFHSESVQGTAADATGNTPPSGDTATAAEPVSKSAAAAETSQDTPPGQPDPSAAAAALIQKRKIEMAWTCGYKAHAHETEDEARKCIDALLAYCAKNKIPNGVREEFIKFEKETEGISKCREPFTKRAAFLAKHKPAHATVDALRAAYGLPAVEKGLYDVAELADLLSWLSCLADFAESEAMWEGDNSKVPEELRASVKQLGEVLLEMAQEEVAEIVGDEAEVEIILELAAKVGDLRKRNTETIVNALGELSKALEVPAAVPSSGLSKVQRAVLDETTHALSKARADLKTMGEELSKARARVTELEKLPAAKAPVLRVIGKGETGATVVGTEPPEDDVAPVMVGGKVDKAATAIKKIHAQQMRK